MAVYTKFNRDKIEKILSYYDLGKLDQFKGIEEGIENTNYFLSADKKKFILTIYEKATVKSVGSIDNSGKKDLVFFDNKESKLKVIKDFDEDNDNETEIISDNSKSKFTSSQVNSKDGKASFVSKNREPLVKYI